jgi:ketosteroid isomerase-like protein
VSRENVDLVRRFNDLLNQGDLDRAFALCDPEVEFDWSRRLLDPIVLRGREAARGFLDETLDLFEEVRVESFELIDLGDDVLDVTAGHFRGRSSGAEVIAHAAIIWTVESGKIVRFRFYQSKDDALADLPAKARDAAGRAD